MQNKESRLIWIVLLLVILSVPFFVIYTGLLDMQGKISVTPTVHESPEEATTLHEENTRDHNEIAISDKNKK